MTTSAPTPAGDAERSREGDVLAIAKGLARQTFPELRRQYHKWGSQDHAIGDWWLILSEEFGELARAALEGDSVGIWEEAVDVMACLARFVEKGVRPNLPLEKLSSTGWVAVNGDDE
jgi:hypothetical protein